MTRLYPLQIIVQDIKTRQFVSLIYGKEIGYIIMFIVPIKLQIIFQFKRTYLTVKITTRDKQQFKSCHKYHGH